MDYQKKFVTGWSHLYKEVLSIMYILYSILKIKLLVILPAKMVLLRISRELQFRPFKLWQNCKQVQRTKEKTALLLGGVHPEGML